jgi:hypothetical protein
MHHFEFRYVDDHYCIFELDNHHDSCFLDSGSESIYLRVPDTRINDMIVTQIINVLDMLVGLNPTNK